MSSGTNSERVIENTEYINNINNQLLEIKQDIENLPTRENIDFSDTTATIDDIVYGKTAYIDSQKAIGNLTNSPSVDFNDINAEVYVKLLEKYNDITIKQLTDTNKTINSNTIVIPAKLDGTSLIDFSMLTTCDSLFKGNQKIEYIDNVNMTKAIYGNSMFENCIALKGIRKIDSEIMKNANAMFKGCTNLLFVPEIELKRCKNGSEMFMGATSLTTIASGDIDTSSFTDMTNMFNRVRKPKKSKCFKYFKVLKYDWNIW